MASADATALWAAVATSYEEQGLITLTNIRDRSATAIDTTSGEDAAQGVIDLWPIYAQADYDAANAAHVEVGKRAVIAMLWQRGGVANTVAKVEWDEVFGDSGLIGRLRKTTSRAHASPITNSGTTTSSELLPNGQPILGWSDRRNLPVGFLSNRRGAPSD